jgi:carbon starvation protein
VVSVWDLVSWGLWVGWGTAIGFFTYGVILRVLGREGFERYIAGSLAAIIVLAFGWGLVQSLYGGVTPPLPYGWVFYAVSGVLLVSSAIYLAMGRAEGVSQLLAALLVVGLGFFAASLSSGVSTGPGGTVSVTVMPSSVTIRSGEELKLTIIPSGGSPPYSVTIDWGDGDSSSGSISESGEWDHTYTVPGDKPATSYTIRVDVADSEGRRGWNILAVIVQNQNYCPLGWPWNIFCGLYRLVTAILPALDMQKLVECPLFPMRDGDPVYEVYKLVLGASMGALGLFLAFNLVWRAVGEEGLLGVVGSIKEAVVAVAIALLAPHVYNATAQALNTISYQLIGRVDIGWVLAWIFLQLALGVVLGYFVPFLANYAAFLAITLFLASLAVYVRYILILTLVAASPLLAVGYLHPALRGAVRHAVSLLAGLMIAGPIAAVFMVVVNAVVPGQSITFGILYPLIVGVLPTLLGALGGGLVTALAGAIKAGVAAVLGGAVGRVAQVAGATASVAPSGVARLSAPRLAPVATGLAQVEVAPSARAIAVPAKLGPIVTPATVKSAVQEARMREAVAEALAEAREIGPGATYIFEGPEAYRKHAEELAKEPAIHPKWEAFKAGIKTLGREAGRRAWTNVKALARESREAFKYHVERELGVRLSPSIERDTWIVPRRVKSVDEWLL